MVVVSKLMQYSIHYSFVVHTSTRVVQNLTPPVHFFFQYRPGLLQHTFSVQTWTPSVHFFSVQTWAHPVHFLFQYRPGLLQYTFSVQTWAPPVHLFSTDLGSSSTLVYLQYTFASPSTKNTFPVLHTSTQASNKIFLQVHFAGGTIFLGVQSPN